MTCKNCTIGSSEDIVLLEQNGDFYCQDCFDLLFSKCSNCNNIFLKSEMTMIDNEYYCKDCRNDNFSVCNFCNEWINNNEVTYLEKYDESVCYDCLDNNFTKCDKCGNYFKDEDLFHFNNGSLCNDCQQEYYECRDCGDYVHEDYIHFHNDEAYCSDCYNDIQDDDIVHEYGYSPHLNFYKTSYGKSPYFGIEMELERIDSTNIKPLKSIDEDYFWITNDGSLNDGIEIKNHPMSVNYIRENTHLWKNLFTKISDCDLEVQNTCGTHIHISNKWLDEKSRLKLILLFEYLWDDFLKLSLRDSYENVYRYAKNYKTKNILQCKRIVDDHDYGRYFAINLNNTNTTEIRLYGGISTIEQFEYLIDLTYSILLLIKTRNIFEIKSITTEEILRGMRKDNRRIAINILRKEE